MKHILTILLVIQFSSILLSEEFNVELGDEKISDVSISDADKGFYTNRYYIKLWDHYNLKMYADTYTGNLLIQRTDFYSGTINSNFNADFFYNSGSSFKGKFGTGFQFKYNIRYANNNYNNNIALILEDDRSEVIDFINDEKRFETRKLDSLFYEGNNLVYNKYFNRYYYNSFCEYYFENDNDHYVDKIVISKLDTINLKYIDKQLEYIELNNTLKYNFEYQNDMLSSLLYNENRVCDYYYDEFNNLSSINYLNGEKFLFEYNDCEKLSKIIFPSNNIVSFKYNDSLQLSAIYYEGIDDKIDSVSIDYFNDRTEYYDIYGSKNTIIYNDDEFSEVIDAYGHSYQRSSNENAIEFIDKKGNLRILDVFRDKVTLEDPFGNTLDYDLNKYGILNVNDKKSNDKKYFYTENNISLIIDYENNFQLFEYNDAGKLSEYIDENENNTSLEYDESGNIVRIKIDSIGTIDFEYDEFDNINKIIDPSKSIEIKNFSSVNNNSIVRIDNFLIDSVNFINGLSINDLNSNIYHYDHFNRLVAFNDLKSNYNNYELIVNGDDDSFECNFDSLYRINSFKFNIQYTELYEYDLMNNLVMKKINDEIIYNAKYDNLNRILELNSETDSYYYEYDENSNLTDYTFNGFTSNYEYNKNNYLTKVIDPLQNEFSFLRDDKGNIVEYSDPNNFTFIINYDNLNRLTGFYGNNEIFSKEYLGFDDYVDKIDSLGLKIKKQYNSFGQIKSIQYDDSIRLDLEYTNNLISSIKLNDTSYYNVEYNNNKLIYSHNNEIIELTFEHGLPTKIQNANNSFDLKFNAINQLTKLSDNYSEESFEYNDLGYLTSITNSELSILNLIRNNKYISGISGPENTLISFDRTPNNLLRSIEVGNNRYQINRINSYRINSFIDPDNLVFNFNYDNNGNISSSIANNKTFTYDYNELGQIVDIITPSFLNEAITYDDNYLLKNIKNNKSDIIYTFHPIFGLTSISNNISSTRIDYDKYMRISNLIYADDTLDFQYDVNDISIHINNEKIATIKNSMDSISIIGNTIEIATENDEIRTVFVNNKEIIERYDVYSNLISHDFFNGNSIEFMYDDLGRLEIKIFSDLYFERFTYDVFGNINQIIKPITNVRFSYYGDNQLKSVFYSLVDSLNYEYDSFNRLTLIDFPNEEMFNIKRNNDGEITEISGLQNSPISFDYNDNSLSINSDNITFINNFDESFRILTEEVFTELPNEYHDSGINTTNSKYNNNFSVKSTFPFDSTINFSYINNLINSININGQIAIADYSENQLVNRIQLQNESEYEFYYDNSFNLNHLFRNKMDTFEINYGPTNEIREIRKFDKYLDIGRDPEKRIIRLTFDTLSFLTFYDYLGNVNKIRSNMFVNDDYFYDASGYFISIFRPSNIYNLEHNEYMDLTNINLQNEYYTNFRYDGIGRVRKMLGTDNNIETNIEYRGFENVRSIDIIGTKMFRSVELSYNNSDELNEINSYSGHKVQYNNENTIQYIISNNDTIRIENLKNSIITNYPNEIQETKTFENNRLVEFKIAKNQTNIFKEVYEYNINNKLDKIYRNQDLFEFEYKNDTLQRISLNGELIKENKFNQINKIYEIVYENDSAIYDYTEDLRIGKIGDVKYNYNIKGQLISKIGVNNYEFEYHQNNMLKSVIKNAQDTLSLIFDANNNLINYTINGEKHSLSIISIDKNNYKPIEIINSGINSKLIYDRDLKNIISLSINFDNYYFHKGNTNSSSIITNSSGELIGSSLNNVFEINTNLNSEIIEFVHKDRLIIKDFEIYYKNGKIYDLNDVAIDFDHSMLPLPFPKKDVHNLIADKIKLKLNDIINIQPYYFNVDFTNSTAIEKNLINKNINHLFNDFDVFAVKSSFHKKQITMSLDKFEFAAFIAKPQSINFNLEPELPKILSNPIIKSYILNKDTFKSYKPDVSNDPLEKIINALKQTGLDYQNFIAHLENIRSEIKSHKIELDYHNVSELPFTTYDIEDILEFDKNAHFKDIYVNNFGNDVNWIDHFKKEANQDLIESYNIIEKYLINDTFNHKLDLSLSNWFLDLKQFMPEIPFEYELINKYNRKNIENIFMLTDPRPFYNDNLFLPGRNAYNSPYLDLPVHNQYLELIPEMPLQRKNIDVFHDFKQEKIK